MGERHGLTLEPDRYTEARAAAIEKLSGERDLVHDEEVWIAFTEQIVLGMGADAAGARACAVDMVREWERHENFTLYEDALPVLGDLRARGIRIGLVTNGQRDLDEFVRHHRLEVDAMVGSKAHGRIKPHPSIFVAALSQLAVAPDEAAMVGDSYEDDIEGARALGMRAIFLDRDGLRPEELDSIDTLLALPAALGLVRESKLPPPGLGVRAERDGVVRAGRAEDRRRLGTRPDRPHADVLSVEQLEPGGERAGDQDLGELVRERLLVGVVVSLGQRGPPEELAQPPEELRLERRNRDVPPVGRAVDAVAGEPAREQPRNGVASEPVRDEVVRAVRHGDDHVASLARARPLEERGEDAPHRAERPGGEVGDLDRGQARGGVLEDSRPAQVVEVVAGAVGVLALRAEARDRAVDDRVGDLRWADPEPLGDARSEALEHDVGASAQSPREGGVRPQVADDGLCAGAQGRVPRVGGRAHRVPLRCLHAHDPGSEAAELAARVRAREQAREVDDDDPRERLHRAGAYLYPRRR